MFYLAICLFVYLLATSHKDLWLVLHENFTREVSLDKEVTVEFCKSYLGIFLKEFLSLWDGEIQHILLIAREVSTNSYEIFEAWDVSLATN